MHLIKDDILETSNQVVNAFCQTYNVSPSTLYNVDQWEKRMDRKAWIAHVHALDFGSSGWIAQRAQTFLFDSAQVMQFLGSIDRKVPPGDYPAPFQFMCIQFSQGIDEKLFTTGLRSSGSVEPEDEILGLLIATPNAGDDFRFFNVVAWYKSASINRVQVPIHGDGEILHPALSTEPDVNVEALIQDKQKIVNLAMLCLVYMTTPGMVIERVTADERVNRKREAKGKKPLPDYYVCRWTGNQGRESSGKKGGSGFHHTFRYDVAGHFRRLPDGKTIWIRPHQRGIEHEQYKPKVYKVK